MYRSLVINLVLLNSLLGVAGCSRPSEKPPPLLKDDKDELWGDDKKDGDESNNPVEPASKDDKKDVARRTSTSSGRSGYRPLYVPHGGYMQRSSPRTQARPGSSSVSRGGFGATGRSAVS
ncbi:MAG: hypothetical protein FJ271_05745 [Planctomycetes bacterium]|nr:hypothetical protein [Planctomycetota bacterium]